MDRREEIIRYEFYKFLAPSHSSYNNTCDAVNKILYDGNIVTPIQMAMDSHFTERTLELLEYMANNGVECHNNNDQSQPEFYFKGEWITKEELFNNFL